MVVTISEKMVNPRPGLVSTVITFSPLGCVSTNPLWLHLHLLLSTFAVSNKSVNQWTCIIFVLEGANCILKPKSIMQPQFEEVCGQLMATEVKYLKSRKLYEHHNMLMFIFKTAIHSIFTLNKNMLFK